jgi:alkaline phosphatase
MLRKSLLLVLLSLMAVPVVAQPETERLRNVILMIPDGFGPASLTMARMATGEPLALDAILTGMVGTTSADSYITDSAAGATAYASGIKSYNGAVGVDTLRQPVGTVLQGARDRGMRTGLVTTTTITHATPAAFAAHVEYRGMEAEIARQLIGNHVDLLLGGGRHYFLPEPAGRRDDGLDVLEQARAVGYQVVFDGDALGRASHLPLIGLFADSHLAYEIDRHRTDQPSLADMSRRAIELLAGSQEGFFLMIEGGKIDHAAHSNDAAAHLFEILAFDEAVAVALDFARADGQTLVVSLADHETGGKTIGRDGAYVFHPEVLLNSTASVEWLSSEAVRRAEAEDTDLSIDLLATLLRETTPIAEFDDDDLLLLEAALDLARRWPAARFMMHVVSRHAGIGWTTRGHTGVDVTLHAFGPGSHLLTGYRENDEVGRIIAGLLEIDLDEVTERVRARLARDVEAAVH